MAKIINTFLLGVDKLMPEILLRQPGFSVSGPFTQNKKRILKFNETKDSRYIYQNQLDKSCFQHVMAMEILKSFLEEQLLIKYYVIKQLI